MCVGGGGGGGSQGWAHRVGISVLKTAKLGTGH